MVIISNVLVCA